MSLPFRGSDLATIEVDARAAVDPYLLTTRAIRVEDEAFVFGETRIDRAGVERVHIVAAGKVRGL